MFVHRSQDSQEERRLRRLLQDSIRDGEDFATLSYKDELRAYLLERQGKRCAYCERQINNKQRSSKKEQADERRPPANKIEHFHPQSNVSGSAACVQAAGCADLAKAPLKLSNMLAVCSGQTKIAGAVGEHCDTSKANTDICRWMQNPNTARPADSKSPELGSLVVVDRDGTVHPNPVFLSSEEDLPQAQEVLDDVLNLNSKLLKRQRAGLYAELVKRRATVEKQSKKHRGASLVQLRRKFVEGRLRKLEQDSVEYPSVYYSFCVDTLKTR
ncbi:hypothetical protein [Corynebacterium sp. NML130628]|uniref:hypothetical protein n=1 Tax=Corynebacterium sp. NML130628 TaxID=1906333 RepID=UPI0008FB7FD2|nr:hypothetical protein [Corynebacterium sp. NML130628]OIR46043.1 hypothetical protein BJP07_02085 [Corynebacterium sp. NML130628]